jgi:hypothetical protein
MSIAWTGTVRRANGSDRPWALLSCPRCGSCTLLRLELTHGGQLTIDAVVKLVETVPEDGRLRTGIAHLPAEIEQYYNDALRVFDAGVPDAAAVQLRRTLEGAAAHMGVTEKTLVQSIEKLIEQGHITKDFGRAVHHIRKIGNLGAHYSDERLEQDEVRRALRFTEQVLRNLFEVPGELSEIEAGAPTTQ